jgi:hypothetical protein
VGGGFAGLEAAKALAGSPVDIMLIDRQNHHCFQPLLYQVATATLSPADVAWPIRSILSRQRNATVLMASVTGIDCVARAVHTESSTYPFDKLIVATGATHAYFGNDAWADWAPGLKSIEDATEIRRRLLIAFENAEQCDDQERRNALMTFAVIGGGQPELSSPARSPTWLVRPSHATSDASNQRLLAYCLSKLGHAYWSHTLKVPARTLTKLSRSGEWRFFWVTLSPR